MKYVSIDIETTGLDPAQHQILQFAAVIEDTLNVLPVQSMPKMNLCFKYPNYVFQGGALAMNSELVFGIENGATPSTDINSDWPQIFWAWCERHGAIVQSKYQRRYINVAGKNVAMFDLQFLNRVPNWANTVKVGSRIIDPAILFADWGQDETLPDLKTCKDRAGLAGEVTHDALDDALDVVFLLRKLYAQ